VLTLVNPQSAGVMVIAFCGSCDDDDGGDDDHDDDNDHDDDDGDDDDNNDNDDIEMAVMEMKGWS
jgi:hypothetical protein